MAYSHWHSFLASVLRIVLSIAVFSPSFAFADRVTTNQQVLYTFDEGAGAVVQDVGGVGSPLDLTISKPSAVRWVPGGLVVNGATFIKSAGAASKVISAIRGSKALTIEAWVIPSNVTQSGSRVVTLSSSGSALNYSLRQSGDKYATKLRTSTTTLSGSTLQTSVGTAIKGLTHVIFTRDASGKQRTYVDGAQQPTKTVTGDFSNWDANYNFGLASEISSATTGTWLGEYRLVAIYSRALTAAEVSQNYAAGPDPDAGPLAPLLPGFDPVSDALWDETAVRKVLHTFAYGGQATDAQIRLWANMSPRAAIVQMLTFDQHNLLLSPVGPEDYDRLDTRDGTLLGLAQFWASDDPLNGIYADHRTRYNLYDGYGLLDLIWTRAANSRGLNPFRQKIGLWETNYHLATNMEVVPRRVMARYYDSILEALETGRPYHEVLAVAAKSAAVAIQYGHRNNVFVNGECKCNEDFAREYHQLFFGILGSAEPDYHETVSIKNTAAALTDMVVDRDTVYGGYVDQVTFGTAKHTPGVLEILHAGIGGSDAAQRLDELSRVAINHPESLDNLPVIIVGGLADDNLNDTKISRIRSAWQFMGEKNLLDFLRAYAVSTLFHDVTRVKNRTSIDRHLLMANLITLNNEESYLDLYSPIYGYQAEDVKAFFPVHNVFGGQTGEEASSSADVFRNNFARATQDASRFLQASASRYGRTWEKNWASVIPKSITGYQVRDVAEWLWQRFVADGLKHLGPLERAHLYALLGAGMDLPYLLDPNAADRVITSAEVQSDPVISMAVAELAQQTLALDSSNSTQRIQANQRIGQAINFIVGTPFMFADEGR